MRSLAHAEAPENSTKVTLILWPLWSGKTTLVKRLLPHYPKDAILIINDVWAINIDARRLSSEQMIALKEWCVCCEDIESLRSALVQLKWIQQEIIIEPSGIAEWTSIKKVLDELGYDTSTIFLWDIAHHDQRSEAEVPVIQNQIRVADIVWLTRDDDGIKRATFLQWIHGVRPNIETIDIPKIPDNAEYMPDIEDYFANVAHRVRHAKYVRSQVFTIIGRPQQGISSRSIVPPEKNTAPVYTISREIEIGRKQLESILERCPAIIRAKWVVDGREFDYVHGDLQFGRYTDTSAYVTFISISKIDLDLSE